MTRFCMMMVIGTLTVGPAVAQAPAATKSDLAPAAATARSGPDAANSYQYPPNTGNILSGANRTPYDPAPDGKTGNAPAGIPGSPGITPPAR